MAKLNMSDTSEDSTGQAEASEADSVSPTSTSGRMIKLGLSIDDTDEPSEAPEDMPELDNDSDMEEVD